jgi:hypothetical protein
MTRAFAVLTSEANGYRSREQGTAAVALEAGQVVEFHPGAAEVIADPGAEPPVVGSPAVPEGYHPYGTAGVTAGTAAVALHAVAAGADGVFAVRDCEVADQLLVVDEADFDDAVADLAAKGVIARDSIVL